MNTLRLILGDQLNYRHSWFQKTDKQTVYLLMEIRQEATYVKHHIQKLTAFFMAMRHFASFLEDLGHRVIYVKLDDPVNKQELTENIQAIIQREKISQFEYLLPDEYRLDLELNLLKERLSIPVRVYDTEHFYTQRHEVAEFFASKKGYLMEYFYRHMRKKHQLLMSSDGKPLQGKWNFDQENRNKLPAGKKPPPPLLFKNPASKILKMVENERIPSIGTMPSDQLIWPVTRDQSLELLQYFLQHMLPYFGTYQDAIHTEFWSLYHARLSFSINTKMLSPAEVVNETLAFWEKNKHISIAQVEGFIRQIIGWREYMRGIYWHLMPDMEKMNYFSLNNKLPSFYWTGDTQMNCLHQSIRQSLEKAYAHHIQRLMVTGNFALLAQTDPQEVDQWYLGIYIDAIQWVELPNTRGMSQFADGGIIATKPYISTANYINKMSNYCKGCHYDFKKKTGHSSCPFSSLYWKFLDDQSDLLQSNPRMKFMYRQWNKKEASEKQSILQQASHYLNQIDTL